MLKTEGSVVRTRGAWGARGVVEMFSAQTAARTPSRTGPGPDQPSPRHHRWPARDSTPAPAAGALGSGLARSREIVVDWQLPVELGPR